MPSPATSVIRDDYLAAVLAADSRDYAPLIELHRRFAAKCRCTRQTVNSHHTCSMLVDFLFTKFFDSFDVQQH